MWSHGSPLEVGHPFFGRMTAYWSNQDTRIDACLIVAAAVCQFKLCEAADQKLQNFKSGLPKFSPARGSRRPMSLRVLQALPGALSTG
jgi:hypothetical protein